MEKTLGGMIHHHLGFQRGKLKLGAVPRKPFPLGKKNWFNLFKNKTKNPRKTPPNKKNPKNQQKKKKNPPKKKKKKKKKTPQNSLRGKEITGFYTSKER